MHGFQGMISILAAISFLGAVAWDRYHQYCTSESTVKDPLHLTSITNAQYTHTSRNITPIYTSGHIQLCNSSF